MKHRDIFRVPARPEHRTRISKAWKIANEVQTETEDLGWFLVVTLGTHDFAFYVGEKPRLIDPMIDLILEYRTPDSDAQS